MKTGKNVTLALVVLLLTATAAFSDSTVEATSASVAKTVSTEKNIFGKIAGGFAESTRTINEINKENMKAVKTETKANFEEATAPSPALVRFREAKGFGNKIKAIVEGIVEGAKENPDKEKAHRTEIQSHESYRNVLENQRANRQEIEASK